MSLKMKLTSTIAAFLLILGLTIMGVMAAPSATVNLGGSISFTATDVNAKVTGDISGATNTPEALPELLFAAGLDNEAQAELNADIAKWGECDLVFDSTGKGLSILVTIENLAERPLYASINSNATMTADVTSTMEELAAADAESGTPYTGDTITIPAKSGETTYSAYVRLSLEVNNKNASLAQDATWGYDVVLNNEEPEEIVDAATHATLSFDVLDENARTAYVYKKNNTATTGDIIIPSKILIDGKDYTVTQIGDNTNPGSSKVGFMGTSISSILIPDTVTKIGSYAFWECGSLTSATMGKGITSIGSGAFSSCGLTNLILPANLTTIEDSAFQHCSSLSGVELVIPSTVTNIGNSSFEFCYLAKVRVEATAVPMLGTSAFESSSEKASIEVPSASLSLYQANAAWSSYTLKGF